MTFSICASARKNYRNKIDDPTVYVFEESEMLINSHSNSEPIKKLVHIGRNYKMSYIALAQRLATVSTSLISPSGPHALLEALTKKTI